MLNLTPSASLLNPGGALLVCRIPAFWVCVLVVICFCATGVAVFGAVIQTDSWITFKEEVVWLGGLAGHLTFRNEFSHMWAGHCRALAGRKEASSSIPGEGSKQFSWNSDWTHLRVEIGEAWPVSFPAGQPMSVSLAQREERGLLSFLVHQVNWRLHWGEAEVDMRLKRVGFRRLVRSWCLPRCWFFLSFSTNGYLSFFFVCVSEILCDVCTSEEREYSPCDYSSQLADFRWPIMKENLNEQFICTWKWRLYWWHINWGAAVHESHGYTPDLGMILCQPCCQLEIWSWWARPAALVLLLHVASSVQIQHPFLITSFAGRNLRPAFCRAVLLGRLHLRWNCEHQEHTSMHLASLKIVMLICDLAFLIEAVGCERVFQESPSLAHYPQARPAYLDVSVAQS